MAEPAQNFANHKRIVPLYHVVAFGILVIWFVQSGYVLVTDFTLDHLLRLFLAIALVLLFFFARTFALTVQDRVIRLEMMLRLERHLPEDLRARTTELELGQLIALRFASDAELPELVRAVLDEGIKDRGEIKRRIRTWRPDHLRC